MVEVKKELNLRRISAIFINKSRSSGELLSALDHSGGPAASSRDAEHLGSFLGLDDVSQLI